MNTIKVFRTASVAVVLGLLANLAVAAAAAPTRPPARLKSPRVDAARAPATNYHFSNMPVRAALVLLAEEGGFSLVVSDSVQGNVSLRLNNVTWEQALDIVLRLKGLNQRVHGTARTVTSSEG